MIQKVTYAVRVCPRITRTYAAVLVVVFHSSLSQISRAQTSDLPFAQPASESSVGSEQYRKSLLDQRTTDIASLRLALSTSPKSWIGDLQKKTIVELLGELRAAEAAGDLVAIVTFVPSMGELGEPYPLQRYPAAYALVRIGVPAHRAIFKRLHHSVTAEELKIFAYILSAYAGSVDAPTGTFYVRRHKPNSKAFPQLQQNLDAIESIMNSPAFGKLSDWPEPQFEPQKVPERIRREAIPVPRIQSR